MKRNSLKFADFMVGSFLVLAACGSTFAAGNKTFQAGAGVLLGGTPKVAGSAAGELVNLAKAGQGVKFTGLPAAKTVAIRYASLDVGTISVAVNDQSARKVNVHSSGDAAKSILNAVIDVAIPAGATVTISRGEGDVGVNIEQMVVGEGDLAS